MDTWKLYALASALFAALTAIFGKIGVTNINSNLATWIRTIVILSFITALLTFKDGWSQLGHLDRKGVLFLVLSGLATGASWLCYYRALQLGPASQVAPIDKLSVVFSMILAFLFLGEAISLKTALGGALIAIGAIILVL